MHTYQSTYSQQYSDNLIAYNKAVAYLNKYATLHLNEKPDLLNFLASAPVISVLNETHTDLSIVIENRFLTLVRRLSVLSSCLPICDEDFLYYPCREVMLNAIELTRVLAEEHFKARTFQRRNVQPHQYENEMFELTLAINATIDMVQSPGPAKNKTFVAAIANMQNSIEPRLMRFMRENPYKTAFISSALIVAGISMFAFGIIITPVIFLAAVALTLTGITTFCFGVTGVISNAAEKFIIGKGHRELLENVSATATSMNSLTKSYATMFAKKPEVVSASSSASSSLLSTEFVNSASPFSMNAHPY